MVLFENMLRVSSKLKNDNSMDVIRGDIILVALRYVVFKKASFTHAPSVGLALGVCTFIYQVYPTPDLHSWHNPSETIVPLAPRHPKRC